MKLNSKTENNYLNPKPSDPQPNQTQDETPSNINNTYINKLQHKIREQALRLSSLEKNPITPNDSNASQLLHKLKSESDKYRKDLIITQTMLTELKSDYDELKLKHNSLINSNKQRIEEGLKENDQCKEAMQKMEIELKLISDERKELIKERDELINKNNILSNKIKDIGNFSEGHNELVLSRLSEYKKNFDRLNEDFEILLNDKSKLNIENSKLKKDLAELSNKINSNSCNDMNYKRKYDELKFEFEDYKIKLSNSDSFIKKLENSYNESKEEFTKKLDDKINEINRLNNETEKKDLQNFKINEELTETKSNYIKLLSKYEFEIQNYRKTHQELESLNIEKERCNKEIIFLNEKYEKDINLKNKEINSLYEELNQIKNEKFVINSKFNEFKNINRDNYETIEELKHQLNTYESNINNLKEKVTSLNKNSEQLEIINNKYEKLCNENIELSNNLNSTDKELSKLKGVNSELLSKNEGQNKIINSLELEISSLLHLKEKYESLTKSNNSLKENYEELKFHSEQLIIENRKNDKTIEKYINDLKNSESINESLIENNKSLQKQNSDIKLQIYTIFSNLKLSINKFNSLANEDLDSLLTNNFSQFINKQLSQASNYITESNEANILTLFNDNHKAIFLEFENIYIKLLDSNNYIKGSKEKINFLENALNQLSKETSSHIENNKKLNKKIIELSEIQSCLEKEIDELNCILNKNEKGRANLLNEVKLKKNEIHNGKVNEEKLIERIEEYQRQIDDVAKIEFNMKFAVREKKQIENLLVSIAKYFPDKEAGRILNEIISLNENIYKTELEKNKIEEKIVNMENEYKILKEDKSSRNEDLSGVVRDQQANMKKLIKELTKKIDEKKEIQKKCEKDFYEIAINVKNWFEQSQKEFEYIRNELNEIRYNKNSNYNTNNINQQLSDRQIINNNPSHNIEKKNNIEISCLESNLFSCIKSQEKDRQITDYDSIINNSIEKAKTMSNRNNNFIPFKIKDTYDYIEDKKSDTVRNTRKENIDSLKTMVASRKNISL